MSSPISPALQVASAPAGGRGLSSARPGKTSANQLAILAILVILAVGTTHIVNWALAPVLWMCVVVAGALMVARRRAR